MQTPREDPAAQPRHESWVWLGVIGPPVVWLLQFQIKYALAARTTAGSRGVAIATSLLALVVVTACGLMSSRYHRLADASPLDVFARKRPRIRFMGTLGVMFSALFFLLIVAQLLADLFIEAGLQ
jgi:hypothetical protein